MTQENVPSAGGRDKERTHLHPQRLNGKEFILPMQEMQVRSLGWEEPLEKEMATHSSILAWEIHGQRNLLGYSLWGHKESDMT